MKKTEMTFRMTTGVFLLLLAAVLPVAAQRADKPNSSARAVKAEKVAGVPRLYVATGPSSETELARLRAAVGKLPGVKKVETRAEFDAVTVSIEGDGSSTESLLTAGARSAGFVMRPVRGRYFAAAGPNGAADLSRLQMALEKVPGVENVAMKEREGGAAVRVFGVTGKGAIPAAAKPVGFTLREVGSYVASGSTAEPDLARLRASVEKVYGVEQVEMQSLNGGATFLIYGEVKEAQLETAAKSVGYAMWPLHAASGPRVFKVESGSGPIDHHKLAEALLKIEGIGEFKMGNGSGEVRVTVKGGRARQDNIVAAAKEAGFTLTTVEPPVALPTLTPEAGRSTPPDYEERVLEEKAHLGAPAPPFTVLDMDGTTKRSLADYLAAKKPVVLVFGSCTCPRFMNACPPLEKLYQTYKDRVTFLLIYIAEAHPGQILAVPTDKGDKELRIIPVITSEAESLANLKRLVQLGNLTMPAAIDTANKSVNADYAAYPNRLYAIGVDGKVAFKGAPGPTGLKVPELEDWLRANVK
jgi:copper chaperone CopZ